MFEVLYVLRQTLDLIGINDSQGESQMITLAMIIEIHTLTM